MNNKTIKEKYLPPTIEVIEMESEKSVMTGSNISGYQPGGGGLPSGRARTTNRYSTSQFSELEDMINDLLTIEK